MLYRPTIVVAYKRKWGNKVRIKVFKNLRTPDKIIDGKGKLLPEGSKIMDIGIGDSFIEGSGYDYEYTFAGLLANELGSNYEILNSAVESYSPSIYFKKKKNKAGL